MAGCQGNGVQPWASSLWSQCDQRNDSRTFLRWKGYTQLYFHSGRSITKILFTQREFACSKPVYASGPLCPHSRPLGLCPWCCHHCSLCSALLQPCSCATVSLRALGRALYIESIATYCPHVCSELADQVRILATGTFILFTLFSSIFSLKIDTYFISVLIMLPINYLYLSISPTKIPASRGMEFYFIASRIKSVTKQLLSKHLPNHVSS